MIMVSEIRTIILVIVVTICWLEGDLTTLLVGCYITKMKFEYFEFTEFKQKTSALNEQVYHYD